jgi:Na+/proline symporter
MISGVIIGLASADVWQRVFAAKSSSSARKGLIAGGIALAAYGSLIVFIGILGKTSGLSEDADNVFLNVLQNALPPAVLTMAVLATISAILSTADTEIFLVSSLLERGYRQFFSRNSNTKNIEMPSNESFNRIYIIVIVAFASILSLWGTELGLIFNWMFVGYMVFAPTIAISLFIPTTGRAVLLSFGATLFLFILLLALEYLTLENAYLLTLPAVIILPYASIKWRQYVSSPR